MVRFEVTRLHKLVHCLHLGPLGVRVLISQLLMWPRQVRFVYTLLNIATVKLILVLIHRLQTTSTSRATNAQH